MPEVSRFFGISIRLYYNDHEPAHFYAIYGEFEALIEIETMAVLRGNLPRRALALVLEWAALHSAELRADWNSAQRGEVPLPIDPLDCKRRHTMALVRILAAEPLGGYMVRLKLTNGEVVERDLTHLLNGPIFDSIREDEARFREVQVLDGTLVWPGGADLCPDTVIWGGLPPADSATRAASCRVTIGGPGKKPVGLKLVM